MKIAKLESGVLIHLLHKSIVSKSTQLVQARSGFWHHEIMEKRTMKVKKKGSNSGEGNHKTEGSPVVDTI